MWKPPASLKNPSSQPAGSVPPVGTRWITRQAAPSYVAGTRPPSVEWITISTGRLNWWTWVPASAHVAVTSRTSGPGPKPLVRPLGAAAGAIRSTSQSSTDDDQAPPGIVADANPSADVAVVEDEELVFFSTYGTGLPDV